MWILIVVGGAAFTATYLLGAPVSRDLTVKLGTLNDWTRRTNPELWRERIEPITPFVGKQFKHSRITKLLKADLSQFGETCQRIQRECKALDRRAHFAMIPSVVYLLGVGIWYVAT